MPGRSFRIARIAGIPVGVSPLWLLIVALITWSLGSEYFPEQIHGIAKSASYALGLLSALLLFASILAHEFGHALVARRRGIEVEEIDLWLLGGVSRMRNEAHEPADELRFALAGPAVTAVLVACFGVLAILLPSSTPAVLRVLVEYQLLVNGLLLVFNLIPAFPLDGGRVLRSLLWRRSGSLASATETAARVGRGFGYLMVALGGIQFLAGYAQGLWFAVLGVFIVAAAGAEAKGAQVIALLSGVRAGELMSAPAVCIPESASAARAGSDYFLRYRFSAFPVVDGQGKAVGLLSLPRLERLTRQQRERRLVSELAERDPALIVSEHDDVGTMLGRAAFVRVGRAVVIDDSHRPIGLLSVTDVQRALRASTLADRASATATPSPGRRDRAAAGGRP